MPAMNVRWNINGRRWTETMSIDLGNIGDGFTVKELNRCGVYRTRQIEIVVTDPVPFVLKCIDEDVEPLS